MKRMLSLSLFLLFFALFGLASCLLLASFVLRCFDSSKEKHPPRVEVGVCADGLVQVSDLGIASLLDQKVFQHLDETFLVAASKACIGQCGADFWFCISSHKEGDRCFAKS